MSAPKRTYPTHPMLEVRTPIASLSRENTGLARKHLNWQICRCRSRKDLTLAHHYVSIQKELAFPESIVRISSKTMTSITSMLFCLQTNLSCHLTNVFCFARLSVFPVFFHVELVWTPIHRAFLVQTDKTCSLHASHPPSFQFLLSLLLMPGLNPSHSSLSLLYGIKLLYGKELSC